MAFLSLSISLSALDPKKALFTAPPPPSTSSTSLVASSSLLLPLNCLQTRRPSKLPRGCRRSWIVSMAPDEEKLTRRSPLDFPIEWDMPKPPRRPDIFLQFSPMKTPLPPPMPADPPLEEDEGEDEEEEEEDPDTQDPDEQE